MDFDFTEEQVMFKDEVRRVLKKECPRELVRELDEKKEFPHDLWNKMAELGWLGLAVDQEYGGLGGNIIDMVILVEELGRAVSGLGWVYAASACFGGKSIGLYGSEEQKRFYLPKLVGGEIKFALGATEPVGGTDLLSLQTTAVPDGDDFVINGSKIFTTGVQVSEYIIVIVRTNKDVPKKSQGISLFIVETGSPGLEVVPLNSLALKGVGTNQVFFSDVRVPKENLLGELDKGWYQLLSTLNNERIVVAAIAVGIGQAAFEDSVQYAKDRYAFGRPIGQYQAIQHYIADMATNLEMARLLTYKAAWLQSLGRPCGLEATMAKLAASEAACKAADDGIQILGGYGFMMDFDMQRYWRDVRPLRTGPVSNEMARNFIAESQGLPRSY